LQHNLGLGGACVVTLYTKLKPDVNGWTRSDQTSDPDKLEQMEAQEQKTTSAKL